jgi:hypothetical protein
MSVHSSPWVLGDIMAILCFSVPFKKRRSSSAPASICHLRAFCNHVAMLAWQLVRVSISHIHTSTWESQNGSITFKLWLLYLILGWSSFLPASLWPTNWIWSGPAGGTYLQEAYLLEYFLGCLCLYYWPGLLFSEILLSQPLLRCLCSQAGFVFAEIGCLKDLSMLPHPGHSLLEFWFSALFLRLVCSPA